LCYVIYKTLPNNTDFTIFKAASYQGFNLAFIGDVAHYHTPLDNFENASPTTMQHQGANALSALLALANASDLTPPAADSLFFDVLARWVFVWPIGFVLPAALAAGRVNAIYEVEPYVSEAAERYGDNDLADIDSGASANFPINGYGALASWAARYPRTARAFTDAIEQSNRIAATDPAVLQRTLEKQLHLSANVVDVMATGAFPIDLDPVQIQRDADLMLRYGQLSSPFNVKQITGP